MSVHYCGNKGNGEYLKHSEDIFSPISDSLKDILLDYFISSFSSGIYYNFNLNSKSIFEEIDSVFKDKSKFHDKSKIISEKLYNQSLHPNIRPGEFYMALIEDMVVDGEMCDAVGIFKSENKETFLKVFEAKDNFELETDNGISIKKLDKGALIFQTEKESGYKVCMIDNQSRSPEIASYWQHDFLGLTPRKDAYHKTQAFIDVAKGFCDQVLTEENNVPKTQQMMMLNRSLNYLKDKDKFSLDQFAGEVMPQPEVFSEFKNYMKQRVDPGDLNDIEDFDISQ
ncbi:MAG: nucleoid-associated protein, partial [Bacteroidota bacterium]